MTRMSYTDEHGAAIDAADYEDGTYVASARTVSHT